VQGHSTSPFMSPGAARSTWFFDHAADEGVARSARGFSARTIDYLRPRVVYRPNRCVSSSVSARIAGASFTRRVELYTYLIWLVEARSQVLPVHLAAGHGAPIDHAERGSCAGSTRTAASRRLPPPSREPDPRVPVSARPQRNTR